MLSVTILHASDAHDHGAANACVLCSYGMDDDHNLSSAQIALQHSYNVNTYVWPPHETALQDNRWITLTARAPPPLS